MVAWRGHSSGHVTREQQEVRSQLCRSVCPWADCLTFLNLYFLTWKTRLMITHTYLLGVLWCPPETQAQRPAHLVPTRWHLSVPMN